MGWSETGGTKPNGSGGGRSGTWRAFLRGLALELDAQAGPERAAAVLRGTGLRMATLLGLPPVDSLESLEYEMNAVLDEIGWGSVALHLSEAERCVLLMHAGLPPVGSAGAPPGAWLAPVLEGLYEGWMGQQPGADASFQARVRGQ
ncbi:MAG: cellulose synthase [Rhodospirillales bacterium]|nr:cellulose synthase [Rhodospirillales bacterium]